MIGLSSNLLNILPFSYPWIMRHSLGDAITVLDVGCGDGALMTLINMDKKYKVTGVDLFEEDLKKAKSSGVYKKLILQDVRKIDQIKEKFDVVFCSQVIEHLTKNEGMKLLKNMENLAKKKVIVATSVGFLPYNPIEGDSGENPLQEHKSGWEVEDFKNRGFMVYGQGTRLVYKEGGIARCTPRFLMSLWHGFSYLLSPINYLMPKETAYLQVAVKELPDV